MANVRIRGKIPHTEWPKILERYRRGQTLTEIARSYHCTAPAIRYIVARTSPRSAKARFEVDSYVNMGAPSVGGLTQGPSKIRASRERLPPARPLPSPASGVWNRINSDIASFLAAMDALSSNDSDENYEALLMATDRLLWGSARTRLELEQVLRQRREGPQARRMSG